MDMALVLLYGLAGKEKLNKIRFLLFKLGIDAREVSPAELDAPLGALAGLPGSCLDAAQAEGTSEAPADDPIGEMLVMCGLSSVQFHALLDGLRQERVPVALKAVLTETNAAWSSRRLHRELLAEHAALARARPKDAAKKSAHKK